MHQLDEEPKEYFDSIEQRKKGNKSMWKFLFNDDRDTIIGVSILIAILGAICLLVTLLLSDTSTAAKFGLVGFVTIVTGLVLWMENS